MRKEDTSEAENFESSDAPWLISPEEVVLSTSPFEILPFLPFIEEINTLVSLHKKMVFSEGMPGKIIPKSLKTHQYLPLDVNPDSRQSRLLEGR